MMTSRILALVALAGLVVPQAAAAARPVHEGDVPRTITVRDAESPYVVFNIWIRAGSQNDPAGKEGLAAFTAAFLAQGATTSNSYQAILQQLYPMASGYGSSADKEMTVFTGRVHRDNLEQYYALFREALLAPAFGEDDFNRIRARTLNALERSRRYSRDEELSKELLFREAYRGTPYEHPVDGYVQSVRAITLADVRDFYRTRYLSNNLVVGLAGGYPDGFVERVRADFDRLPSGQVVAVPAPQPRMPDGVHVLIVEKETDATAISMGFPIPLLRGQPDFIPLMTANSWLGEHRNSFAQLYQVIRETRGMNYGDYSYIEAFPAGFATQQPRVNVARRSQLFEIWIRPIALTEPGNLHDRSLFATRAAWRELHKLVDDGLPAAEVERTKEFLHNYAVNWGNTLGRRLAYAMDDAFYGIQAPGFLAAIRPGLAELTTARVNEAIRRNLQHGNMYVVFITADAEGMKCKLLAGQPTGITYAGERPAAVLEEDRLIASFPIPVREENIRIIPIAEVFER
jgi:zinc protease